MSDFGQNAEARELRARKKMARKARLVFRNGPGLLAALERQGVHTTERTATRWLSIMSEKAFIQNAVKAAMRDEADRLIAELLPISRGEFP